MIIFNHSKAATEEKSQKPKPKRKSKPKQTKKALGVDISLIPGTRNTQFIRKKCKRKFENFLSLNVIHMM